MSKILVVDDESDIQKIVRFRLEKAGYEVFSAGDGQSGLELASREKPNLILLDVRMPKMDGYEMCLKLKSDPALKSIPVIFLTASQAGHIKEDTKNCGAQDYLIKPFEPQALLDLVKKYLGSSQ